MGIRIYTPEPNPVMIFNQVCLLTNSSSKREKKPNSISYSSKSYNKLILLTILDMLPVNNNLFIMELI
jgi:hypothetical protein